MNKNSATQAQSHREGTIYFFRSVSQRLCG